jgi:hypothetical protein
MLFQSLFHLSHLGTKEKKNFKIGVRFLFHDVRVLKFKVDISVISKLGKERYSGNVKNGK